MDILRFLACPQCQGPAERTYLASRSIIHTQCQRCDYIAVDGLMAKPWSTGGAVHLPC